MAGVTTVAVIAGFAGRASPTPLGLATAVVDSASGSIAPGIGAHASGVSHSTLRQGKSSGLAALTSQASRSQAAKNTLAHQPLVFEANVGQADPSVAFVARSPGATLFVRSGDSTLELFAAAGGSAPPPSQRTVPRGGASTISAVGDANRLRDPVAVLRFTPVGANPSPSVTGDGALSQTSNFLIGNVQSRWRSKVQSYSAVQAHGVYPGIDERYHGDQGAMEYDWVLRPNADPSLIRLRVAGATGISLDAKGNLVITTAAGTVLEPPPVAYQDASGVGRRKVAVAYSLHAGEVGLVVGGYDHASVLVIDPVIAFATLIGGSVLDDLGNHGLASDSGGNVYLAGSTSSLDFPTSVGALQPNNHGGTWGADAFVTKLDPTGSTIVWSTYLGGSGNDGATAVAVDGGGRVYVTGWTLSMDFPVANAVQNKPATTTFTGFISALSSDGSSLVYSTYMGGSTGETQLFAIAVDSTGAAYVGGAASTDGYPTVNAFQATRSNAVITKLDPRGAIAYSTYLGGLSANGVSGVAVDRGGELTVVGTATGQGPGDISFPTTPGAVQVANTAPLGGTVLFVTRFSASGTSLVSSTLLGGSSGKDAPDGVAVDGAGNTYVTGSTASTDFPVAHAEQPSLGGGPGGDAFVAKLSSQATVLEWSTYLGGSADDAGGNVALDSSGNAVVAGFTNSSNFPVLSPVQQATASAFAASFNGTNGGLNWSTYLGGNNNYTATARGLAVNGSTILVGGFTGVGLFPQTVPTIGSPMGQVFVEALGASGQTPIGGPLLPSSTYGGANYCARCEAAAAGSGGDPVNTADGNFYETFSDIAISGRGFGLSLARTYNSQVAVTDPGTGPFGFGWSMSYGMSLNPTGPGGTVVLTQENGAQVSFTLSGAVYIAPPRVFATLAHNPDLTWTVVRNQRETDTFSRTGQLTSELDLNGNQNTFGYTAGQLTSVTENPASSSPRSLTLAWTGTHITKVTDPIGRTVSYQYNDGAGNLTDVVDVAGNRRHFVYNADHTMSSMTDPRLSATSNVYDTSTPPRVTSQSRTVSGQVRTTHFVYAGGQTTITDPAGHISIDTYVNGLRMSATHGVGAGASTWQYSYDPATLGITAITDPNQHVTNMSHDMQGDLLSSTDALQRITSSTYDTLNDVSTTTDGNGVTADNWYDARGNLLETCRPLIPVAAACPTPSQPPPTVGSPGERITVYTHGDVSHPGDVTATTDSNGQIWRTTYDARGYLASTTSPAPLSSTSTTTYDAIGWPLTAVSPKGNVLGCGCASQFTTTYGYVIPGNLPTVAYGDVQTVTDPLGHVTTHGYDANRNRVSVRDGVGNLTGMTYDEADELTVTTRADGTTASTDYNLDGTVADQKDGRGTTILGATYDTQGRPATSTDALGNVTTLGYDPAGNVVTKQDPGGNCAATTKVGCTSMAYDVANQLLSVAYSDGTTPAVGGMLYDRDGQMTARVDGGGTWAWGFDSLHHLTSVTEGTSGTVTYTYDLLGHALTVTSPGAKKVTTTVTNTYDASGRWASTKDWLGNTTTFGYDANSNLATTTLPAASGVVDTTTYDNVDQPATITDRKGAAAPFFAATYSRDGNSQVTGDSSQSAKVGQDHYTPLNQLCYAGSVNTAACSAPPTGSTAYTFDAGDNLTRNGTVQQTFNLADQLCWTAATAGTCAAAPSTATSYTYDTRGNQTKVVLPAPGVSTAMAYDQADRLKTWTRGTASATYTYDGGGLRMKKLVGTKTTAYVWNVAAGLPVLLQEGATIGYVNGPGGLPLEQVTGTTVLYLHHDQLGSTRAMTDSLGTVAATFTFDAYGKQTASTGTVSTTLRYAGQYRDAESGLYYLRARYYDPATAQFLTRDPAAGMTRSAYAFANGAPTNFSDPSGLVPSPYGIPQAEYDQMSAQEKAQAYLNWAQQKWDALQSDPNGLFATDPASYNNHIGGYQSIQRGLEGRVSAWRAAGACTDGMLSQASELQSNLPAVIRGFAPEPGIAEAPGGPDGLFQRPPGSTVRPPADGIGGGTSVSPPESIRGVGGGGGHEDLL